MKEYSIKAHPTRYAGVLFRSRLEARWAAFFELIDWEWEYEPIDLEGWSPDFRVAFPCGHSECPPQHTLLVEVKPYFSLEDFDGHPCMAYPFGHSIVENGYLSGQVIPADASAAFGANPGISYWEMVHGAGGGGFTVLDWIDLDADGCWKLAGEAVQWRRRR